MVTQLCKHTKNHWIVHLQGADFMICKLYNIIKLLENGFQGSVSSDL